MCRCNTNNDVCTAVRWCDVFNGALESLSSQDAKMILYIQYCGTWIQ